MLALVLWNFYQVLQLVVCESRRIGDFEDSGGIQAIPVRGRWFAEEVFSIVRHVEDWSEETV
jgi:hypothetical protein